MKIKRFLARAKIYKVLYNVSEKIPFTSSDFKEWRCAPKPDPKISNYWRDEYWPPSDWEDIIDLALGKIETLWIFDRPWSYRMLARRITKEQLYLWAVLNISGQVCNGGFYQALFNSYGELAEESIAGLRMFGLSRHAEIFDEAFNAFGIRPIPRNGDKRLDRLFSKECEYWKAQWDDLETEYFKLLEAKSPYGDGCYDAFNGPIAEWIYDHRDRFFIL